MFYRVRQFHQAVWARLSPAEYRWAKNILSEAEFELFCRQSRPDQRHALDVARDIESRSSQISGTYGQDAYLLLLQAALLHDCGKSRIPPRLWQRVFIVLAGLLPKDVAGKISGRKSIWGRTLKIYQEHPSWGKELVLAAGSKPELATLIANHHRPASPLERILYEADCRH